MPAAAATPNSNQWFYVKFESLMTDVGNLGDPDGEERTKVTYETNKSTIAGGF
jgi:hypothetical protein